MGGAERNERRRRQDEAAARRGSGARGAGRRDTVAARSAEPPRRDRRVVVGISVAAAMVAMFAIVYVALDRQSGTPVPPATYPVAVDGAVVTAGQATAPVTVDLYEDYLCPACERFQNRWGGDLGTALNEGRVKVNYHALNILDARSSPPGYSTLAANAALCAVPAGIWPAFHDRLFAEQPAEGGPGLTAAQLSAIGTELGAGPGFGACVEANGNAAAITAATGSAAANPALQTDGQFGTPTVAVGGRKIDISDSGWLSRALAGG